MSEEEFDELLDLMSENNLTQHGADTLYGEIVSRGINARLETERLNNEIKKLKEGLYKILKLNKYMINCSSQKVIYKFLIKQWYLIYEVLGEIAPGLASCSKGSDKE